MISCGLFSDNEDFSCFAKAIIPKLRILEVIQSDEDGEPLPAIPLLSEGGAPSTFAFRCYCCRRLISPSAGRFHQVSGPLWHGQFTLGRGPWVCDECSDRYPGESS